MITSESSSTTNHIDILISHKHARALIDTGAFYSCINAEFVKRLRIPICTTNSQALPQLYGANGSPLRVIGTVTVDVSISGYLCPVEFVVINGLHHNVIFGISMLRENKAVIDVSRSCLSLANNLLTVPLIQRFAPSTIVRTVSAITVAPYHEVRLPVHISQQYKLRPSIIEPLHSRYSSRIAVAKAYVSPTKHTTVCQLVNLSDKPITLPVRTAIATITPAELVSNTPDCKHMVSSVTDDTSATVVDSASTPRDSKMATLRTLGFSLEQSELDDQQFGELIDLLYDYKQVFVTDIKELPGVKGIEYDMSLQPGARPKRQRQYRYPPHMRAIIREQLQEWERAGIISEGDPLWIHPIVLVKKKPIDAKPNDEPKYRICLDLRAINKVMEVESYPMPTLNSIIESFGDPPPRYYTVLDALSGFLQVNVSKKSSKFLGPESDSKTYVMNRVPFGLVTSPFVFQKLMNRLLSGYQFIFACAYIDDLICWGSDWQSHITNLRLILDRILDSGLRLRADKCKFAQTEIKYLGVILSQNCLKPDTAKLSIIKNAIPPTTAKLLKSFLGLTSFYRKFIRGYAKLCQPFRKLLKKNAVFNWTDEHDVAFNKLKDAMTSEPICLSFPNWNEEIVLISDSSRLGCGYIIANEDRKGVQHVIAYGGRQWTKHESMWSVSELELAGILYALESNSQYFIGRKFKIYTDHISNTWVQNLKHSQG